MWIIVRTDFRKEQAVAVQIGKKGFPVWVPVQIITKRPTAARQHMDRANTYLTKEAPVCPSLLFAAVPLAEVDRIMGIRHLDRIEQTAEQLYAVVPDSQVQAFREAIDRENTAALMLTAAARRKQKKTWKSLQEGLLDLVAAVTSPQEQAA